MKKHLFITIALLSLTMQSVAQKYFEIYRYNKKPHYILTTYVDSIGFWSYPYTENLVFYWNDNGNVNKYVIFNVDSIKITNNISPLKPVLSCPDSNHPHMIDLGLPSGALWACCNVGASKPEDYGGYYAWGETYTKSSYTMDNYAYYNRHTSYHYIGYDICGTQYDAATANWGSPWVMPGEDLLVELINYCKKVSTTQNGVNGMKFTGPNGGTIFFPADYYWTSDLCLFQGDSGEYAQYLEIRHGDCKLIYAGGNGVWRYQGLFVRPVVDVRRPLLSF